MLILFFEDWNLSKTIFSQPTPDPDLDVLLPNVGAFTKDQNRKRAISFLRMAKKASGGFDNRKRVNNMWIRCANLEPVIQYLSQR